MEFKDIALICEDCSAEFIFTADEQHFFRDKEFKNLPKRCKACRLKRATADEARRACRKRETVATCASCGKATMLPFRPTQGRPVLCRECFTQKPTKD